jgi:putative ABC transport system permease protein
MTERDWRALVRARLTTITGDPAHDEDIVEELAQHLSLRFDEHVRRGIAAGEAAEHVLAELEEPGALADSIRQAARSRRPAPAPPTMGGRPSMWRDLVADIRYGTRVLLRARGFTAAAVLTLTLGIGATTAIFSVVNAVLLRPVPFAELDRLTMVWQTDRNTGTVREPSSLPDYLDVRERSRSYGGLAALAAIEVTQTPLDGAPARLSGVAATHDLLPLLGIRPLIGRSFNAGDDTPGGPQVTLISEQLWERNFQRSPDVIGRSIRLNDVETQVIGVVPRTADFGLMQILRASAYSRGFADRDLRSRVDIWQPLQGDPAVLVRFTHPLLVLGRLAPGASVASAQAELTAIMADLERQYAQSNANRGAFVEAMPDVIFSSVRGPLWVLLAAVGFVLLIACVNVANLLLARGAARAREVAVRTAMGAPIGRLVRQFAAENLVLTAGGALLGVGLAFIALRAIVVLAPADIPRVTEVGIDGLVLAVTAVVTVATGLLFGLVPALQARRLDVQGTLKAEESRGTTAGREGGTLRSILVVSQVALAVVLVIGAGLLMRTMWRLSQVDTGYEVAGVVKAELQLPNNRYRTLDEQWPNFTRVHAFNTALLARVKQLPGVEAAEIVGNHPVDPGFQNSWLVVGREAEAANWPEIRVRRVGPAYFDAVRLEVSQGRPLSDADVASSTPVVLINEATARRFFEGYEPVGQEVRLWGQNRQVVGVVRDESIQGLAQSAPPALYLPFGQAPSTNGLETLIVRTSAPVSMVAGSLRAAVAEQDPQLAVYGIQPLSEALAATVAQQRFTMLLLVTFAGMALALAAIGIHGVLSCAVAQRRHELGIRMALGAPAGRVTRLVVGQGTRLVALGLALGVLAAIGLTRLLASQLYGVTATDLTTFLTVIPVLAVVALVATWLPARRAMRIDPVEAMRT